MTAPVLDTEPAVEPAKPKPTKAATQRKSIAEVIRHYDPDLRWFAPIVAGLWVYSLAGVPAWTGLSSWWLLFPGVASTVAGVWLALHFYTVVEYDFGQRRLAASVAIGAGAAMTAWMVYAGDRKPTSPSALGLLIVIVLVAGMAFAAVHTRAPRVKVAVEQKRAEVRENDETRKAEVELTKVSDEWDGLIDQAKPGCGLSVVGKTDTKGGFYLDILDNPTKPVRFDGFADMVPTIASLAAARFASQGIELADEDVVAEKRRAANMFRLHVYTSDEFRQPLEFPMDRPVGTIKEPRTLGKYKDSTPVLVSLCGNHGVMCAGTGGGKSVFANNLIAGILECCDAELWIGGTDKLAPLTYSWLLPYFLGRTDKPAIEYVAGQDAKSVTEQLAELYRIAKLRNRKLGRLTMHVPTPTDPAYVYLLEEASDLLMDHSEVRVLTFDGHRWNASQILNALGRMARAAAISIFLLTQFGIMDALGTHGALMRRNLTFRVVGRTNTYSDGRDILTAMSAGDCTKLRDFTIMVQPSLEMPRVIPAKAFHLEGADKVGPVSEKYTARKPTMADWLRPQMGDAYRKRWDADRLPELFDIVEAEGLTWPGSPSTPSTAEPNGRPELPAAPEVQESDTMSDDVKATLAQASAKMDEAIAQAEKYGPLGPLMGEIFPMVNAENSPEFIPAGHLAFAIDRVPEDGDWDTAGTVLAGELKGKPWYLEATTRDGELGWPKGQILGTIRAYLEGNPVPGEPGSPRRVPEPLGTLLERLDGDSRDFVTTVEAAALVGMSAAELQRVLEAEPFTVPSQRPRTVADGERPRGWFVTDLRRAAGV